MHKTKKQLKKSHNKKTVACSPKSQGPSETIPTTFPSTSSGTTSFSSLDTGAISTPNLSPSRNEDSTIHIHTVPDSPVPVRETVPTR